MESWADARQILERTPRTLESLLLGIDDAWTRHSPAPGAWSPFDIVGHLIHGEREDWVPRARIILAGDSSARFVPFDREAHLRRRFEPALAEEIATFQRLRRQNLETLDELRILEPQLDWQAIHPEFGPVTLRQLLATWVVHDLTHLGQISRTMSGRYQDAVGPWRHPDYLRVLTQASARRTTQ